MAPGTRTPNGRKLHDEYAGLPSDLNTRLAAKTVARLKAVFSLRTATEARAKHQTNEHRSKAFNARLTEQILMAAFVHFFAQKVTTNICPVEPLVR